MITPKQRVQIRTLRFYSLDASVFEHLGALLVFRLCFQVVTDFPL